MSKDAYYWRLPVTDATVVELTFHGPVDDEAVTGLLEYVKLIHRHRVARRVESDTATPITVDADAFVRSVCSGADERDSEP